MKQLKNVLLLVLAFSSGINLALDPVLGYEIQAVQEMIDKVEELKDQVNKLGFWNNKEKQGLKRKISQLVDQIGEREVGIEEYLVYN